MTRLLLAAALVAATAYAGSAHATAYKIDPRHTQVQFTYNHFGYSNITGRFMGVTGSFDFDAASPARSSISVELPMNSLSTGVPGLDEDLSSEGFFDVAKFPTATFKSNKVTMRDATHLDVAGDLTIHGVTKPTVLAVTINHLGVHPMRKTEQAGFDAVATIKRSDFGVNRMVPMVSDEVQLHITMEAGVPKPEAAPAAAPEKKG